MNRHDTLHGRVGRWVRAVGPTDWIDRPASYRVPATIVATILLEPARSSWRKDAT